MTWLRKIFFLLALPSVLFAIWWFASAGSTSFFFPPLRDILGAFGDTWTADRWSQDVAPSIGRLLVGYLASCAIGITLGVCIGRVIWLRQLTEPLLEFLRAIPPPVLVPVIMLFAGIGDGMKIIVIISGCVWPILLNTVQGVRGIDSVQTDTAAVYGFSRATILTRVVVPAASPQIVTGMRQALSIGVILMVISEMFAAHSGLGFAIVQFQRSFAIPAMWSGVILLGLLGVTLALLFHLFDRRALHWYYRMRS